MNNQTTQSETPKPEMANRFRSPLCSSDLADGCRVLDAEMFEKVMREPGGIRRAIVHSSEFPLVCDKVYVFRSGNKAAIIEDIYGGVWYEIYHPSFPQVEPGGRATVVDGLSPGDSPDPGQRRRVEAPKGTCRGQSRRKRADPHLNRRSTKRQLR